MERNQAKEIAIKICYQLQPFCNKINIAGSIRRQNPHVKDIEVICSPKTIITCQDSLFGEESEGITFVSEDFIKTVNSLGKIIKGKPTGKMMQIQLPDIMLDLFIPDDYDYYRQYAIRTGSAEYSQRIIATGWNRIGWVGSDKGLRKEEDCKRTKTPDGKLKWKCINKDAELPPVWASEEDFFAWIKVNYVHPMWRN